MCPISSSPALCRRGRRCVCRATAGASASDVAWTWQEGWACGLGGLLLFAPVFLRDRGFFGKHHGNLVANRINAPAGNAFQSGLIGKELHLGFTHRANEDIERVLGDVQAVLPQDRPANNTAAAKTHSIKRPRFSATSGCPCPHRRPLVANFSTIQHANPKTVPRASSFGGPQAIHWARVSSNPIAAVSCSAVGIGSTRKLPFMAGCLSRWVYSPGTISFGRKRGPSSRAGSRESY